MGTQFKSTLEDLFQQSQENIIVFNRSKEIVFINSNASKELHLSNTKLNHLQLTTKSENEWTQFIKTIEQNMTASCCVSIINDDNQKINLKIGGYLIKNKQLIFGRVLLNFPGNFAKSNISSSISFQRLINGMANGVVITSLNGEIISANVNALQLLNRNYWQIEKRSYDCLFEECHYDSASIIHYYKEIANNELASIVVKSLNKFGQPIYLNFVSKIDEVLGVLITTIIDHTETMLLIDKIEHHNALSFMGQNVATIVHEIRNPMTSIQGFIQMIKSNSVETEHPYFQIVETELQRMDELLIDLLNFSKPNIANPTYVNLQLLIEQVIELMQPRIQASKSKIIFEYEEDEMYVVYGHENRLKQMLVNLLKNAIESLETLNTISIRLHFKTKYCLQLSIADQGKGIEATQIGTIFEPFYSTKETGTGLGLLLVQTIANEHNGTINIESEVGKGTKFIIDFELRKQLIENQNRLEFYEEKISEMTLM